MSINKVLAAARELILDHEVISKLHADQKCMQQWLELQRELYGEANVILDGRLYRRPKAL